MHEETPSHEDDIAFDLVLSEEVTSEEERFYADVGRQFELTRLNVQLPFNQTKS